MYSANIKWTLLPLFLFAILCALVVPTFAQEQFGTVAGVVKDPSGAVIPDTTITVKNKDTNRAVTMQSRNDGSYTLPDVEPGHYSIVFEKTGFNRAEVPDVLVVVGRTTTLDMALKLGAVQELVEVNDAALAIDTSATMIAGIEEVIAPA